MKLWIINHKLNLLGALLVGLIVGYIVSLYYPTSHVLAESTVSTSLKSSFPPDDNSYWKGIVDERLRNLLEGQEKVNKKLEALDCSITEIKIGAAKQGGIYGGIASLIVLFASILGKGLFKSIWGTK